MYPILSYRNIATLFFFGSLASCMPNAEVNNDASCYGDWHYIAEP